LVMPCFRLHPKMYYISDVEVIVFLIESPDPTLFRYIAVKTGRQLGQGFMILAVRKKEKGSAYNCEPGKRRWGGT
jgi:hypothetical protein